MMFKFAEKFHCVRRNARVKDTIPQSTWCEKGVKGRGLFGIHHWQSSSLMVWCTPFSKFEVSIPIHAQSARFASAQSRSFAVNTDQRIGTTNMDSLFTPSRTER